MNVRHTYLNIVFKKTIIVVVVVIIIIVKPAHPLVSLPEPVPLYPYLTAGVVRSGIGRVLDPFLMQ